MMRASRVDLFILRLGLDVLLESVRQSETWWRACGDSTTLDRTRQWERAIQATRRKFFADAGDFDADRTEALIVAEGLRDAARQCREGQGALHARLIGGAEVIERLCRKREE